MAQFTPTGVELVVKGSDKFFGTLDKANSKIVGFGKTVGKAAVAGMVGFGAAVGAVGAISIKAAIGFESAFAGVIKTTDGLVDEMGNLTQAGTEMQQEFRDLAKTVPTAVEELLAIGELGGQLGIAKEDLVDFTRTIAAMGEATNLTAEEAATAFAQIANVMQTPQELISNMGSSVVALGNTFATTESDIVNFSSRIAGAGKIAGVTEAQVFGISAAFTSVGIGAQAGGTSVSKALIQMNTAVTEGGDQLEIFATTAGLTADEFGTAWEEDAGAVFGEFVKGLGTAGDDAVGILEALEIQDSQAIRAFLSLAGAGDLVTEALETSTLAFAENTALTAEAEARYRTTESQFKILKNVIKDVAITIGQALLPFINKLLVAAKPLIEELGKRLPDFLNNVLVPAIEDVAAWIGTIVEAFEYLAERISWWGLEDLFKTFEDGSSAMQGFFETLGLGERPAKMMGEVINKLANFLGENIPKAIKTAKSFFTNTLLPALRTVWDFIKNSVIPAIGDVVGWLSENIPVAIQTASDFWTDTLQPALEDVGDFITDTVVPAIEDLVDWLEENIPDAMQAVKDFWENTLKPAFDSATDIIMEKVIPAIEDLAEWLADNIPAAFGAVQSAWVDTLKPALGDLQSFIEDNLEPILAGLAAVILTVVVVAFKAWATAAIAAAGATIAALGPVVVPLVAIGVAVGALYKIWQDDWGGIRTFLIEAWEGSIKPALADLSDWLSVKIPIVVEAVKEVFLRTFGDIISFVETDWPKIKAVIEDVMNALEPILEPILSAIEDLWDEHGIALIAAVMNPWNTLRELVQGGANDLVEIVKDIGQAMYNAGKAIVENLKQGIADEWERLTSWFKKKLDELLSFLPFSEPKDKSSPLANLGQAGAAIVTNLVAGMDSAIPAMMDMGTALGEAFIDALRESLEEGEQLIDELFKAGGVFGGIGSFAARLWKNQLKPLKGAISDLEKEMRGAEGVLEKQRDSWSDINNTLKEMMDELLDQTKHNEMLEDLAEDRLDVEEEIAEISERIGDLAGQEAKERAELNEKLDDQLWRMEKLGQQETEMLQEQADLEEELAGLGTKYADKEAEEREKINDILSDKGQRLDDNLYKQDQLSEKMIANEQELAGLSEKYAGLEVEERERINDLLDTQREKITDLAFQEQLLVEQEEARREEYENILALYEEDPTQLTEKQLRIMTEGWRDLGQIMALYETDRLALTQTEYNIAKRYNGILEDRASTQESITANEEELAGLRAEYAEQEEAARERIADTLESQQRRLDDLISAEGDLNAEIVANEAALAALAGKYGEEAEEERQKLQADLQDQYDDMADFLRRRGKLTQDIAGTEQDLVDLAVAYGEKREGLVADLATQRDTLREILYQENKIRDALDAQGTFHELAATYYLDRNKLTDEQIEMFEEYLRLQAERTGIQQDITDGEEYLIDLEERHAELAEKYRVEQERILALQKKQEQLKFLEEQMKLLDLIAEHGLDAAAILGGLEFGLDLNLPDLIDAMIRAMAEIVDAAEAELQISSDSKVFARIGAQLMGGLAKGVQAMAQRPLRAVMRATMPLVAAPVAMATGGAGTVDNSVTMNMGPTTISNDMEMAQFETRVLRIVRGDMR